MTAAYELSRHGHQVIILEKEKQVGGISRTINYKGYLFDLGGHRFFTKYEEIEKLWHEVLPDDFLKRPRLSRIYYKGKFFYYPLKPLNALINLGTGQALLALLSYLKARIKPYKNADSFEKWVTNKFGRRLYKTFFKTYTEKVWGIPCSQISADWAAQRIKGLSLSKAVLNAFGLTGKNKIRTLIDEFLYPRRGPGQFWEKMAGLIEKNGGKIILNAPARIINFESNSVTVGYEEAGRLINLKADRLITSAPLKETLFCLNPKPSDNILETAKTLGYRDFFTVGLIIKKRDIFPDNWIYIHSPEIAAGRLQNFKNWSSDMVPDINNSSLGLEYFCFSSDSIWLKTDQELIDIATSDIEELKMARSNEIIDGTVIRVPKAYPVYDHNYQQKLTLIKDYLKLITPIQVIGRNGLHRYNNQDHSMLMGLYAARNIMGASLSVWDINLEDEYHEEKS